MLLKPTTKDRNLPGRNSRELPGKMSENYGRACWGLPLGIFRDEFQKRRAAFWGTLTVSNESILDVCAEFL